MVFDATYSASSQPALHADSNFHKQYADNQNPVDQGTGQSSQSKLYSDAYKWIAETPNSDLLKPVRTGVVDAVTDYVTQSKGDTAKLHLPQIDTSEVSARLPNEKLSPDNLGLTAEQIFKNAMQSYKLEGMTEQTKRNFEDSIRLVDVKVSNKELAAAQSTIDVLSKAASADGTKLSESDTLSGHAFINGIIGGALERVNFRREYAMALIQSHQNASAEKILKDNVKVSEQMPVQLMKNESEQLLKDSSNEGIRRATQADFYTAYRNFADKDRGAIYESLISRQDLAHFYINGKFDKEGVIKPEKALQVLDEAQALAQKEFSRDLNKDSEFQKGLKDVAVELLPENLKKAFYEKDLNAKTYLTDATATGLGFLAAGIVGTMLTRNSAVAKLAFEESGALTTAAKVAGLSSAAGVSVVARHLMVPKESWSNSLIHGSAGVAAAAAVFSVGSISSKVLFNGATESSAIERLAMEKGAASTAEGAAVGTKDLSAKALARVFASREYQMPKALEQLAAQSPDALVVKAGKVVEDVLPKLNLTNAQAAKLVSENVANKWRRVGSTNQLADELSIFAPEKLDLLKLAPQQVAGRSFVNGIATAASGFGTYNTITALDRPNDPKTGKPIGYLQSIMENNSSTLTDAVIASLLATTFKSGVIQKTTETSGFVGKVVTKMDAPFRGSYGGARNLNAVGRDAILPASARAAFVGASAAFLRNPTNLFETFRRGVDVSGSDYSEHLKRNEQPIVDKATVDRQAGS